MQITMDAKGLFHKRSLSYLDSGRNRGITIVVIVCFALLFHSTQLLAQPEIELSEEGFEALIKRNPAVLKVEFGKVLLVRTHLKIYVDATRWKSQDPLQRDIDFSTWFGIWKNSGGVQLRIIDYKTNEILQWKQFK